MAGSISSVSVRTGNQSGGATPHVHEFYYTFIADAADASIPNATVSSGDITGGFIVAVGVDFTTPAPSALVVTIKDTHGITLYATSSFSADGTVIPAQPIAFTGALTVVLSGNATNSAQGKVVIRAH